MYQYIGKVMSRGEAGGAGMVQEQRKLYNKEKDNNYTNTQYSQYSPMLYQDLNKALEHLKLMISKLQQFQRKQLECFCETNLIKVQQRGIKKPIKAAYVAALFNAVCTVAQKNVPMFA